MSVDKITELHEQKLKLAEEIRSLADVANGDEGWSAEDRQKWEAVNDEYDKIADEIVDLQERSQAAARAAEIQGREEKQVFARRTEVGEMRANRRKDATDGHRYQALAAWLKRGRGMELSKDDEEACHLTGVNPNAQELSANLFNRSSIHGAGQWYCRSGRPEPQWVETRDMSLTAAAGGYTVPEGFQAELEKSMLAYGNVRGLARIVSTASGNDVPWPTATDHGNVGAILAENTTMGSSVDPTFGVITLKAYKYSSTPVLCSSEILEDSAFNLGVEIASMLGERVSRITNQHFTTGDNSSKPQGVVTGASTGKTAAAAAAITADELIDLQESLDFAYQMLPSVGWMFHQSTRKAIRQLKDGNSAYIWQPGLRAGEPDLLLDKPYVINNDMDELATTNDTVLYGAFEKYIVRDVANARFYRLEERYRDLDQTGFILFSRHDGRVLDAGTDPFKKLTQA